MKKVLFVILALFSFGFINEANAQFKPNKEDIGRDCTTQDNKLGTWKEVTVRDSNSNTSEHTNSSSVSGSGSLGGDNYGAKGSISGGYSDSSSRGSSRGEEIEYKDIRCIEDKNATLPQQSPVRW